MIEIPHAELSPAALEGVIDAFILREGTDYGHADHTLDEKRRRVKLQLEKGQAAIFYHPDEDFVDLRLIEE